MEKATKKYIKTAYQIINNNQFGKPTRKFNHRAMVASLFNSLQTYREAKRKGILFPEQLPVAIRAILERIKWNRETVAKAQLPF